MIKHYEIHTVEGKYLCDSSGFTPREAAEKYLAPFSFKLDKIEFSSDGGFRIEASGLIFKIKEKAG